MTPSRLPSTIFQAPLVLCRSLARLPYQVPSMAPGWLCMAPGVELGSGEHRASRFISRQSTYVSFPCVSDSSGDSYIGCCLPVDLPETFSNVQSVDVLAQWPPPFLLPIRVTCSYYPYFLIPKSRWPADLRLDVLCRYLYIVTTLGEP